MRDSNHFGAKAEATKHPPPWKTCEAALSEAFFLLGTRGSPALAALLRREALSCGFNLANDFQAGHALIDKYANVPMSLADACLVRMTETLPNAILITTDSDFQIYRRYSRRAIPAVLPK
jgi:predicted nucleic acid-binding protein